MVVVERDMDGDVDESGRRREKSTDDLSQLSGGDAVKSRNG